MQQLTESQTQVYINGGVTPQYGTDNLQMLTSQFFKSGRSDAQVLAILCGMGVPQPWAMKAIQEYNALNNMGGDSCGECAVAAAQENVGGVAGPFDNVARDDIEISVRV